MATPAIKVEGLGKRYRIAHGRERTRYHTLRDTLVEAVKAPFRKRGTTEEFWALSGVSFSVQPGEVVGIIGRNGAGKSTLLKILSRITKPTQGRVELNGRVGSLLEVGTGFHPELTGRENIYLNGAILGMTRAEIANKFDDIVEFSGVEKFLDTPVKRFSSGMYVRLAFAVAAHLEPEILIVDEVLAVGDVGFREKCMKKMKEVALKGLTVLFVSHDMSALLSLCNTGIWLERGKASQIGGMNNMVEQYLRSLDISRENLGVANRTDRSGLGSAKCVSVRICRDDGCDVSVLCAGDSAVFEFIYTGTAIQLECVFTIYDQRGTPILSCSSANYAPSDLRQTHADSRFSCRIHELPLVPGKYIMNIALMSQNGMEDHLERAHSFEVVEGLIGDRPINGKGTRGFCCTRHRWTTPGYSASPLR